MSYPLLSEPSMRDLGRLLGADVRFTYQPMTDVVAFEAHYPDGKIKSYKEPLYKLQGHEGAQRVYDALFIPKLTDYSLPKPVIHAPLEYCGT